MTVYRTNPQTGAIETIEPTITEQPVAVPNPAAFRGPSRLTITDYSARENRPPPPTIMRLHKNGLESAQANFARIQDAALQRGLMNPDGSWSSDPAKGREVALAKLQLQTAREAVAYEQIVVPALQAERDAVAQAAWEDQAGYQSQVNAAKLTGQDHSKVVPPITRRSIAVRQDDGSIDYVIAVPSAE